MILEIVAENHSQLCPITYIRPHGIKYETKYNIYYTVQLLMQRFMIL